MPNLDVLCAAGAHCGTCRDPAQRAWRESLAKAYELPAGAPNFECPRGLAWGHVGAGPWAKAPSASAPGQVAEASAALLASAELRARRLEICGQCPHQTVFAGQAFCGVPLAGGLIDKRTCGCLLSAKTALSGSKCPDGRW